jgi:translation initiation factor IF-1
MMRIWNIRIVTGERVVMDISPYYSSKGNVIFRPWREAG